MDINVILYFKMEIIIWIFIRRIYINRILILFSYKNNVHVNVWLIILKRLDFDWIVIRIFHFFICSRSKMTIFDGVFILVGCWFMPCHLNRFSKLFGKSYAGCSPSIPKPLSPATWPIRRTPRDAVDSFHGWVSFWYGGLKGIQHRKWSQVSSTS